MIATGFHRNTMVNTEGGTDDEEFRVAAIVDRVNTTMTVWMGTTSACTQCHNHKFDPFKQKEFYQLFAFFNSTADHGRSNAPELSLPTPEQAARIAKLQRRRRRAEEIGCRVGVVPRRRRLSRGFNCAPSRWRKRRPTSNPPRRW